MEIPLIIAKQGAVVIDQYLKLLDDQEKIEDELSELKNEMNSHVESFYNEVTYDNQYRNLKTLNFSITQFINFDDKYFKKVNQKASNFADKVWALNQNVQRITNEIVLTNIKYAELERKLMILMTK